MLLSAFETQYIVVVLILCELFVPVLSMQVLSVSATPEQQSQFSAVLGTPISANSEIQGVRGQEKKCVKLRGLPFQCGPEAVIDFFGPLKNDIASKGVHMVLNSNVSVC